MLFASRIVKVTKTVNWMNFVRTTNAPANVQTTVSVVLTKPALNTNVCINVHLTLIALRMKNIVILTWKFAYTIASQIHIVKKITSVYLANVTRFVSQMNIVLTNSTAMSNVHLNSKLILYCELFCRDDGVCTGQCSTDDDCKVSELCLDGQCSEKCMESSHCGTNEKCLEGQCRSKCFSQSDCFQDEYCHTEKKTCFLQCQADTECSVGHQCFDGQCSKPCQSTQDCLKSQFCHE